MFFFQTLVTSWMLRDLCMQWGQCPLLLRTGRLIGLQNAHLQRSLDWRRTIHTSKTIDFHAFRSGVCIREGLIRGSAAQRRVFTADAIRLPGPKLPGAAAAKQRFSAAQVGCGPPRHALIRTDTADASAPRCGWRCRQRALDTHFFLQLERRMTASGWTRRGPLSTQERWELRALWKSHTFVFRHVLKLPPLPRRGERGQVTEGNRLIGLESAWLTTHCQLRDERNLCSAEFHTSATETQRRSRIGHDTCAAVRLGIVLWPTERELQPNDNVAPVSIIRVPRWLPVGNIANSTLLLAI